MRTKASSNFDFKCNKKGRGIPVLSNLEVANVVNHTSVKLEKNQKCRLVTGLFGVTGSYRLQAFSKLRLSKPLFTGVSQPDCDFLPVPALPVSTRELKMKLLTAVLPKLGSRFPREQAKLPRPEADREGEES